MSVFTLGEPRLGEELWELPLDLPVVVEPKNEDSPVEQDQKLPYETRLQLCDDMHDKHMRGEITDEDFDAFIAEFLPEALVQVS